MKTKRIFSLLLTLIMVFSMPSMTTLAADNTVEWAGAANFNSANNQVTSIAMPTEASYTMEKWVYALNTSVDYFGAYYAGQPVIVDNYLYTTGGGSLHKINASTGDGSVIADSAGSISSYYDYLCYADGILIVATQTKLEAFSLNGTSLGSVEGSYSYYHPVQYYDNHIICNGYIYKLDITEESVTFTQVGEAAIGADTFNWNSGVFLNGLFCTASKNTVYAVDYTTGEVKDSYVFDSERTASGNLQGGIAYDAETGRLFWGTYSYNTYIHSISINENGEFDESSYISADSGQKSVCTPLISGGRVYLAGQSGNISVMNASDLAIIYSASVGAGKIQSTPVISTANDSVRVYVQSYDGHIYMMTDNGNSGDVVCLAKTKNYSNVKFPNSYEQITVDLEGNIYCYNESGYLFCFQESECEVPSIITDLSAEQVKAAKDSSPQPLTVEAAVNDGGVLSYQWQWGTDGLIWTDIDGAVSNSYTPKTDTEGIVYYRCVVTNTNEGNTAYAVSSAANILVKVLSSDTTLNVLVNHSNSITSSSPEAAVRGEDGVLYVTNRSSKVYNIWLGTVSDGTVDSFEILQGLDSSAAVPNFTKKTSNNVYNGITYNGYYRSTAYTLPIVAKAVVTAEDGKKSEEHYIVIDSDDEGKYVISAKFTLTDQNGDTAISKDGATELYKVPVLVTDADLDGTVTLNDAFIILHTQHSTGGADDFASSDGYMSKLWGVNTYNVGYLVNNTAPYTLLTALSADDDIVAFFYLDTTDYSDLYTYFDNDSNAVSANETAAFTVNGLSAMSGTSAAPSGASVTVFDENGNEVTELATAVNTDGKFELTFTEAGTYTVEVSGTCSYTGSVWDYINNGYASKDFTAAPVIPSRCTVCVSAAATGGSDGSGTSGKYAYISVKDPKGKTYHFKTGYTVEDGETAYSLLLKTGLDVKATNDNQYGGVYVESIEGLGELDKGGLSGWMYSVNGDFPEYSASLYALSEGDYVEWIYTRNLGGDVGDNSYGSYTGGTVTVKKNESEEKTTETDTEQVPDNSEDVKALPFADISGHWAYEAVKYVAEKGLMNGTGEGFEPDSNMTRAMLVTVLYRLENTASKSVSKFEDVPSGEWYSEAVGWAAENGIAVGISDTDFAPYDSITREQMAVIIYRYAKLKGYNVENSTDLSQFTDASQMSGWAVEAGRWANSVGIIEGTSNTTISPKATATRAQVAAIIMRFNNLEKE